MRKGFTLIELLVVIAIIAILAAILFPVFARAREKALQNNCLSNVKQLQLGILMYASDNNETYPVGSWSLTAGMNDWPNAIYPYVKNTQLYICPADGNPTGLIKYNRDNSCPTVYVARGSYGCNASLLDLNQAAPYANSPVKSASILYPGEMLGVTDASSFHSVWWSDYTAAGGDFNPIHNNGCNMSFVDGHAKWMAYSQVPITNTAGPHFWLGTD